MFGPELIRINYQLIKLKPREGRLQKTARGAIFFAALAAKFWKRDIRSASERAFPGVFGCVFGCSTPSKKRCLRYTRINLLLVNGVVTASNHALWRVLSNIAIWLLGHFWVDTPHINTFQGDSVFKMKLLEAPTGTLLFITKTLSKRLCTRYCWRNMVCRRSGWSSWTRDRT